MSQPLPVETYSYKSNEDLKIFMKGKRRPVVLKDFDVGSCKNVWTVEYLSSKLSEQEVKVHVSPVGTMSFLNKNFCYKTLKFSDFINRASRKNKTEWFLQENEYYYLRSIGFDKRGRDIADLKKQFPNISSDIEFPGLFETNDFFSSVFRISSEGVQVWTHYDIMDNMLIQVVGEKRVVLFSPEDTKYLYLKGDKSEVLDIDNVDSEVYPKFNSAKRYECVLKPGDVLFIPALWFHNTLTYNYGISVNVFWKNLPHDLYDKTDVYGNKDLLPASKALSMVDKGIQLLRSLPKEYRQFYIHRAILALEKEDTNETGD